ncbi:MAG: 50S ribosomal protein L29 [Lentisphaerae bacterium ADurb.BinA184]|nr:MAG: 50S ribosomal protein L29 [Lentisphaerae bacterium ADurb.BinA184]
MNPTKIRELTPDELTRALNENRRELFNLRLQQQTGQLESTARIRAVRRDVARLLTEINARQNRAKAKA